jgi:UDP-GlcNAc:undecaprenyl-phosphate/decaprenyl-phosphate GlcNAc-1-phosphate transferase
MEKIAFAFLLALVVSLVATPFAIKIAHLIGAIDVPRDTRRIHKKPIPRLGGLAIYAGFTVSFLVFSELSPKKMIGILLGSAVIIACGIYDDTKGVTAKQKLFMQLLAAVILFAAGIKINYLSNPFDANELIRVGLFSFPLTIIWIAGITNTVNLIDGLDGLAGGVSAIAAVTLGYIAFLNGRYEVSLMTFVLAGGCLGFLPYNFNPAKVFMGDTGALFIGFILAAISIDGSLKSAAAITTLIPIIALGLPIFDTTFAILRRAVNGKPIMEADKGHFHHRLLYLGLHQREAVLMMYMITFLLGATAALFANELYTVGIVTLVITIVIVVVPVNMAISRYKEEDLILENEIYISEMESYKIEHYADESDIDAKGVGGQGEVKKEYQAER